MAFRKECLARLESEIDCPKQVFELGTESAIEQAEYLHKSSDALFVEALKLGESAAKVYMFLWDAAGMDNCRKTYNSNNWTVKGIAGELKIQRKTVTRAIHKLLDDGLIQIIGEERNSNGSCNSVWAVTHYGWIDNVRYAIGLIGDLPSIRLQKMRTKSKKVEAYVQFPDIKWLDYDPAKQFYKTPANARTATQEEHIQQCLELLCTQ